MASTQLLKQLLQSNTVDIYLRAGAFNHYVPELQTLLHELGYSRQLMWEIYGADGYYGENVIKAVRAFAQSQGVRSDGMVMTPYLLNQMLRKDQDGDQGGADGGGQQPEPEPQPQPQQLQINDLGDRVAVSNGQERVELLKRGPGFAYWGKRTIDEAIRKNENLIESLGLTKSAINVMKSVSDNEGKLDAINSHDRGIFSFGIYQWTIGPGNGEGELAALLKKVRDFFPNDFQKYFGVYGIGVSPQTDHRSGFLTLNGKTLRQETDKEQFRAPEWAFYFWLAGQDDQVQSVEIEHAVTRLNTFYWDPAQSINGFTLSEIITSEYGVALILDHHVNRPAYVQPSVERAMQRTGLQNPTFWSTTEERQVLEAYIDIRKTLSTGSAAPMADADRRAQTTRRYVQNGIISDQRNSFQFNPKMIT